jgi:hypothetical protein
LVLAAGSIRQVPGARLFESGAPWNQNTMQISEVIEKGATLAKDRCELWTSIINDSRVANCAEIGVFRGDFAQTLLQGCPKIETYYMVDPWRHLADWNKPFNTTNNEFVSIREEALRRTDFAATRRVVLQGRTVEVSCRLPDEGLDLAYIDGDHTLRGITIDLIRIWPKMKSVGILAGDDFAPSVWTHPPSFEPTLVFPMAVFFAEAVGAIIYGLPFGQFAIVVDRSSQMFEFRDLTGTYKTTSLRDALTKRGDLVKKISRRLLRAIDGLTVSARR